MKHLGKAAALGLLMCGLLTGCNPSVARLAPQSSHRPWEPEGTQAGASAKFELPEDSAPLSMRDEIPIDANRVYDLPELIDLAERTNPDTRIAWEQSRQAAFAVGLAEASYLPQITAEFLAGVQHLASPIPPTLISRGYFIANTNELLPSLVVKWLLFDFGKRSGTVEAAKQASIASNVAFTGAHQKLIFEVAKAYFTLDAERAQLHVAEDALKTAITLQDAAEAKKSGVWKP